jgi:predicted DNA-binding transcriptional regulator AlpA
MRRIVPTPIAAPDRYLRRPEVCSLAAVGSTTLYRMIVSGEFPPPRVIHRAAVGWLLSEVLDWMRTRPQENRPRVSGYALATGHGEWRPAREPKANTAKQAAS